MNVALRVHLKAPVGFNEFLLKDLPRLIHLQRIAVNHTVVLRQLFHQFHLSHQFAGKPDIVSGDSGNILPTSDGQRLIQAATNSLVGFLSSEAMRNVIFGQPCLNHGSRIIP